MPTFILHKNVCTSPQCSSEKLGTNQWQELTHVGMNPWRDCTEFSLPIWSSHFQIIKHEIKKIIVRNTAVILKGWAR